MIRLFFTPTNAVLAVLLVAAAIAGLFVVPAGAILPVHWGIDGQPDAWQPREIALLFPLVLAVAVGLLMAAIRRWGNKGRAESAVHVLRAAFTAILLLALGIEVGTVLIGAGYPVSMVQIVCLCVGVLFVLIGNAMPKSQPNGFAGLRIRSTLNDAANWQATHRLTGVLMIAAGVVIAASGFLIPPSILLFVVMVVVALLPGVIGTIYSLMMARRSRAAAR